MAQITCHTADKNSQRFGTPTWCAPRPARETDSGDPHARLYHTCSYCGSISAEDLLVALEAGAKAEVADWKYGWPHKIYVEGIPNPKAGQPVHLYTFATVYTERMRDEGGWERLGTDATKWRRCFDTVRAPEHIPTKFYSVHLKDATVETFQKLAGILFAQTGIAFSRNERGELFFA